MTLPAPTNPPHRDPTSEGVPAQKARKKLQGGPDTLGGATGALPRVLLIVPARRAGRRLEQALHGAAACVTVSTPADAFAALAAPVSARSRFDVVMIDTALDGIGWRGVLKGANRDGDEPRCVIVAGRPSLDIAVEAMRLGAADVVCRSDDESTIRSRVLAAVAKASRERDRSRREAKLRSTCRKLSADRKKIALQVDALCADLADAYQELADHMAQTTLANEFAALLKGELDIESSLRACLEFLLPRTGPTNAAVYLPSNHTDFSLGAYVNYDIPRDSSDVLLDHLADALAPRFQDASGITLLPDREAVERTLGQDAHWLADRTALIATCRHDGECLAIISLFRDTEAPFTDDVALQLRTISEVFAAHLGRVIRIHHRHRPDDAGRGFGEDSDDDSLAA